MSCSRQRSEEILFGNCGGHVSSIWPNAGFVGILRDQRYSVLGDLDLWDAVGQDVALSAQFRVQDRGEVRQVGRHFHECAGGYDPADGVLDQFVVLVPVIVFAARLRVFQFDTRVAKPVIGCYLTLVVQRARFRRNLSLAFCAVGRWRFSRLLTRLNPQTITSVSRMK